LYSSNVFTVVFLPSFFRSPLVDCRENWFNHAGDFMVGYKCSHCKQICLQKARRADAV